MSGVATFIIVSRKDSPIYEAELGTVKKEDSAHLHQFIVHAALDVVDEVVWSTTSSYVPRPVGLTVSCFCYNP